MEKLIELLKKYDKEKGLHTYWKITQNNIIQIYGKWVCSESYLVSKSYGFIKWLVENEKIDYEKVKSWEWNGSRWHFETVQPEYYIIMLLSIQDNPIEFLVSILK